MIERFTSIKFLLAVAGSLASFGNYMWNWGLSTEEMFSVFMFLFAFLGVEGAKDMVDAWRGK